MGHLKNYVTWYPQTVPYMMHDIEKKTYIDLPWPIYLINSASKKTSKNQIFYEANINNSKSNNLLICLEFSSK